MLAGVLLTLTTAHAAAQTMVSVARDTVNMRAGPGTGHEVLWELSRGYPLRVLGRRDGWLQVRDFEGDSGWVLGRLTGRTPHAIVKVQRAKLAFEKEQGQLVETLAATRTVFARARAERDAHMAWVQRTAPLLAAEVGADPRATFAALDRMMREHLEYLADMPLGSFGDGA